MLKEKSFVTLYLELSFKQLMKNTVAAKGKFFVSFSLKDFPFRSKEKFFSKAFGRFFVVEF